MSMTKLTNKQFIERCISVHGDKFDYSMVEYINSITKINIICNTCKHIWKIIPGNFTHSKQGCPNCKKLKHQSRMNSFRISQEEFIKRCTKIHDNKYDYSYINYMGMDFKIAIICKEHGEFFQIAYDHSIGRGCTHCRTNKILKTKISKGIIRDFADVLPYELYCNTVWNITERNFKKYKDIINPNNLKRGNDYHLDHIFSMQQGFKHRIEAEIIGHHTNLRLIPSSENRIKHSRCDKTIEKLLEDYNSSL